MNASNVDEGLTVTSTPGANELWVDCPLCGWGREPGQLCTNPDCEDSPDAQIRKTYTPEEKEAVLNRAQALMNTRGNRASRRGNPTGRGKVRVLHQPPVALTHDGLTPEARASKARNEREQEARRRSKLRKRRHDQRVGRKRTR